MRNTLSRSVLPLSLAVCSVLACGDRSDAPKTSQEISSKPPGMSSPASLNTIAQPLPPDAAPADQQIYRYLNFEPVGLDFSMTGYQSLGSEFVFERLCMLDHNLDLVPGAAERWEASPDGRIWTFHLNPKARWSDGNPVTAQDFEYTFRRLLDPNGGNVYAFFYYDIKGAKAYNQRKTTDAGTIGVRAIDALTLEVETENPCAYLPYIVQYPTSSPVPRWQVQKYGVRWTEPGKCVTNSAYQLDEWLPGKWMSFGLNPYYDGPNRGRLRKITRIFTGYVGSTSAATASGLAPYENNETDLFTVTSPVDLSRIRKDATLKNQLWEYDGFATQYLYFRTQALPFNDLRVRQAFAHAIDKEEVANVVLGGTGIPAYTMLPPRFPGYVGDKYGSLQRYDASLAKRLLAEAGYPNGKGFPTIELWLSDVAPGSPVAQVAQALQQKLADVLGVKVTIRNVEGKTYLQKMYTWEIPLAIGGFGYDYPDPQSYLGVPWRSQPRGYGRQDWVNADFDAAIDKGTAELDPARRTQYYDEGERLLAADVGAAFLWHTKVFELRKPWLKGIKQDRGGGYPFRGNVSTVYYDLYIGKEAPENRIRR